MTDTGLSQILVIFGRRVRRLIDLAKRGGSPAKRAGPLAFAGLAFAIGVAALVTPRFTANAQRPTDSEAYAGTVDPEANATFSATRNRAEMCMSNVATILKDPVTLFTNCNSPNRNTEPLTENVVALKSVCNSSPTLTCDGNKYGVLTILRVNDLDGMAHCLGITTAHAFSSDQTPGDGSAVARGNLDKLASCELHTKYIDERYNGGEGCDYPKGDVDASARLGVFGPNETNKLVSLYRGDLTVKEDFVIVDLGGSNMCNASDIKLYSLDELRDSESIDETECDFIRTGSINGYKFVDWNRRAALFDHGLSARQIAPGIFKQDSAVARQHTFVTGKGTSSSMVYKKCGTNRPVPVLMTTSMVLSSGAASTGYVYGEDEFNDPLRNVQYGMSVYKMIEEYFRRRPK